MEFDLDRVRANVRAAATEDLLDRATVYRAGLEPQAVPVVLEELKARGVTAEAVVQHEQARAGVMYDRTGTACSCDLCPKPAVAEEWGWHRMFGKVPVFPRLFQVCEDHRRKGDPDDLSLSNGPLAE
jgi:hypothetical protein